MQILKSIGCQLLLLKQPLSKIICYQFLESKIKLFSSFSSNFYCISVSLLRNICSKAFMAIVCSLLK
jgi:hypothetical protein